MTRRWGLTASSTAVLVMRVSASALAATATVLWVTSTGGPVHSTPLVVDGTMYLGTPRSDLLGSVSTNVYAYDAATGEILWGTDIGGDVESSPAIANGILYIGSGDDGLYALDADTGQVLWVTYTGGPVHSTPLVADGTVYLGTPRSDLLGSVFTNVYAYDAATGEILWGTDIGGDVESSPAIANGILYIGSGDDGLYAISLDSDDDGVSDASDVCPGTVADSIDQADLKNRHYAWYGGDSLVSGGDHDPSSPSPTLEDAPPSRSSMSWGSEKVISDSA